MLGYIARMVHADGGITKRHPQVEVAITVGGDGIPGGNKAYADVGFGQRLILFIFSLFYGCKNKISTREIKEESMRNGKNRY